MKDTTQTLIYVMLLGFSMSSEAINPLLLKGGQGILVYDSYQPTGPDSTVEKTHTGQWAADIQTFNQGANAKSQFNRIYTYSGALSASCVKEADCIYSGANKNVFVGYASTDFGPNSVAAYRASFPTATIFAIIDADAYPADFPVLSDPTFGINAANELANEICSDPNVDGVLFDLEPANFATNQGQYKLYRQTAINFASPQCKDANHPDGRNFAIYMNPNSVKDWPAIPGMLGITGFLMVDGYDTKDSAPPPAGISAYQSSITGRVKVFMNPNSITYKIAFTVVLPAAATFTEFQKIGTYISESDPFQLTTDYGPAITQYNYIHTGLGILQQYATSGSFLGVDYWRYAQYTSPDPKNNTLTKPNLPPDDVIQVLQNQ
ncbi:MAG: hypothetical protein NXI01_01580 [Gammaproteobacteria bacterium]|nr:hypothetical protein [Gammaproteobacteria bacterium]